MKLAINKIHHVAIICADYEVSKKFYTEILGLEIIAEIYREERKSYKLDLKVNNDYQIELFSFENPPSRPSRPESTGLRHIAFEVDDVLAAAMELNTRGVATEAIRVDEFTGKSFTFFEDPDHLPIELYQK